MQAVNRIEEEKLSVIAVEYIIRTACFDKKNVLLNRNSSASKIFF